MIRKKKICACCGEEKYIFSNKCCKSCVGAKQTLLSSSGLVVPKKKYRLKSGVKGRKFLDFMIPVEEMESYSLSSLKRICDFWFRKYLLAAAVRNSVGKIFCELSQQWMDEESMHVCHYVDREVMSLRYSEDNCMLCSGYSNTVESGIGDEGYKSLHHRKFAAALLKKDKEILQKLELFSKEIVKYRKVNYLELIKKYKEYVDKYSK